MSRENVEAVRFAFDLLNRGDLEGLVNLCDDDFEMDMSERVFNPETYRGAEGLRRFLDGVKSVWESYRWNLEETLVAGDSVVALLHCEAQSREGGPRVDWHVAWLWTFQRGTPIFVRFYRDPAHALEAVGLRK